MEPTGPTSGLSQSPATATGSPTGQWQPGQLLQATVTESRMGKVLLAIGNRQVSAETSLPLEKGQQLTLQVRTLGEQPVLKITTPAGESPINPAIRLLLPKQGPMPPLLATLGQLARHSNPAVPAPVNQLVRSVVSLMPDIQTATSPQGLKKAVGESGVFLERQLLQQSQQPSSAWISHSDFKANLLRLVQLLRHWPGTTAQAPQTKTAAAAAGRPPSAPATTPLPGSTGSVAGKAPTAGDSAVRATVAQTTPPASPDQIKRAFQARAGGKPASAAAPPAAAKTASLGGTPGTETDAGNRSTLPSSLATGTLPPPLRGALPVPQPAIQNSLELLSRMANFRTDLLQQTEAALARIQLHQLATLPREGERGLLEWLFELPIRRGDEFDLWSMRVFSEPRQQQQGPRQQASSWSVQLAFDLPGLGPMQAQVQLTGERVSTRFWAENRDILPLLHEHMHELRSSLSAAGLDVGELECQPGPRPAAKPAGNQALVREKA